MMRDWELLQQYATGASEEAFAELVNRHLNLVYCAALRQVRSPELAEEVAQSVFTDLARNARRLNESIVLTAWLYQVARRSAIDVVRRESRRQNRERIAAADMNLHDASWIKIEPLLDDAMESLDPPDRTAILLRYFENKSLREVGQALGASEDAAQKRVSRALDRMREFFAREGVAAESSGLAAMISTHAISPAPAAVKAAVLPVYTAGITKAIAMTAIQKICVVAALAATIGVACYESERATTFKDQAESLRRSAADEAAKISASDELRRQLDEASRALAVLREQNSRLQSNAAELPKLRGQLSLLRANQNDASESAANSWLSRVDQLKARLAQTPKAKIPEMQYLTDNDWLNAAKGNLSTDDDYRRALSGLRTAAENEFISTTLKPALNQCLTATGKFPASMGDLQPYFSSPVDDSILARWQVAPQSTVPSIGVGDAMITEVGAVDEYYDSRIVLGKDGGQGQTSGLYAWEPQVAMAAQQTLQPALQAYQAGHNGAQPSDLSLLEPYLATPEQQAAFQTLTGKGGSAPSSH